MSITLDLIKGREIGKAVNRLRKHGSDKISKLAKNLIEKWKEMVDQLINMPKEVSGNSSLLLFSRLRFIIMAHAAADDGTPEFATLSIVDEAEDFPSLPHDLDFYALEPTAFELSKILDSLDCDGNICDSVEPKHERKLQSNAMKKPEAIVFVLVAIRKSKLLIQRPSLRMQNGDFKRLTNNMRRPRDGGQYKYWK
ncbi:hypothetical protein F2Q69_00046358 [Brassica cretica]|uniref:TFIIS N-terminal domain-containing protein n=1 Tax=Brassica cretica TaxID=69181 RepID=A0A8S9PJK7_BRACR|nr:hypothetical protein F2Q69_00046358 [Brassica cretica]